mgnify:CR=1 FL=1
MATPPRCWLSGWKSSTTPLQKENFPRAGRHRRPHRAAGGEHHRAVRHPRWQTQPDGIYHIESRKRPEPRGLCPGDGPDPPDTGTFCIYRPPAGGDDLYGGSRAPYRAAGAPLRKTDVLGAALRADAGRHPHRSAGGRDDPEPVTVESPLPEDMTKLFV